MNWTEKDVIEILKNNPYYDSFTEEFDGKFVLQYVVSNIRILIFNEVGGYINGYFEGYSFCSEKDIISARNFLRIAVTHFRKKRKINL